ncbi:MAG: hypothetical protein WA199_14225, partial [Xanthobacteraceae bacterium]
MAIVVTDRAARGRFFRGCELAAAGNANKGGHGGATRQEKRGAAKRRASFVAAAAQFRTLYFLNQPIICAQASSAASLR